MRRWVWGWTTNNQTNWLCIAASLGQVGEVLLVFLIQQSFVHLRRLAAKESKHVPSCNQAAFCSLAFQSAIATSYLIHKEESLPNFVFLQFAAQDSPFLCLLLLTLPTVSRLSQVNVCVCVCVRERESWEEEWWLMTDLCKSTSCDLMCWFNWSMKWTHTGLIWERPKTPPLPLSVCVNAINYLVLR